MGSSALLTELQSNSGEEFILDYLTTLLPMVKRDTDKDSGPFRVSFMPNKMDNRPASLRAPLSSWGYANAMLVGRNSRRTSQNEASSQKVADVLRQRCDVMHLGENFLSNTSITLTTYTFCSSNCRRKSESLLTVFSEITSSNKGRSQQQQQKKAVQHCVPLGRALKTWYLKMLLYQTIRNFACFGLCTWENA